MFLVPLVYAIALYVVLFFLRVLPVLEIIGHVLMSPFLKEGVDGEGSPATLEA